METLNQPTKSAKDDQKAKEQKSLFEPVFVAAVGGATLGGFFGLPGALLGALLGAGFRLYYSNAD